MGMNVDIDTLLEAWKKTTEIPFSNLYSRAYYFSSSAFKDFLRILEGMLTPLSQQTIKEIFIPRIISIIFNEEFYPVQFFGLSAALISSNIDPLFKTLLLFPIAKRMQIKTKTSTYECNAPDLRERYDPNIDIYQRQLDNLNRDLNRFIRILHNIQKIQLPNDLEENAAYALIIQSGIEYFSKNPLIFESQNFTRL